MTPLMPPPEFVARLNACEDRRGMPALSTLDPLTLLAWHVTNEVALQPSRFLLLGSAT